MHRTFLRLLVPVCFRLTAHTSLHRISASANMRFFSRVHLKKRIDVKIMGKHSFNVDVPVYIM